MDQTTLGLMWCPKQQSLQQHNVDLCYVFQPHEVQRKEMVTLVLLILHHDFFKQVRL